MTALEIQHDYEAFLLQQADDYDDSGWDEESYRLAMEAAPVARLPTEEEIIAMCVALGCEVPF